MRLNEAHASASFYALATNLHHVTNFLSTLGDSVSQWLALRLAAREVVSSTLPYAPVAQWVVTAWAANNCDRCHVALLGRLFTHRMMVPKPTQPFIPPGSVNEI